MMKKWAQNLARRDESHAGWAGEWGNPMGGGAMPSAEQLSQLQQQMQKSGMPGLGGGGFNPFGKGGGLPDWAAQHGKNNPPLSPNQKNPNFSQMKTEGKVLWH